MAYVAGKVSACDISFPYEEVSSRKFRALQLQGLAERQIETQSAVSRPSKQELPLAYLNSGIILFGSPTLLIGFEGFIPG